MIDKQDNDKAMAAQSFEELKQRRRNNNKKQRQAEIDRIIKMKNEGASYLEIFHLKPDSSSRDVRLAFLSFSMLVHPDKNRNYDKPVGDAIDGPATTAFKIVDHINGKFKEQLENKQELSGKYEPVPTAAKEPAATKKAKAAAAKKAARAAAKAAAAEKKAKAAAAKKAARMKKQEGPPLRKVGKKILLRQSMLELERVQKAYISKAKRSFFNKPNKARIKAIHEVKAMMHEINENPKLNEEQKLALIVGCVRMHKKSVVTHHKKKGFLAKIGLSKVQGKSRLEKTFDKWLENVERQATHNGVNLKNPQGNFKKYQAEQEGPKQKDMERSVIKRS